MEEELYDVPGAHGAEAGAVGMPQLDLSYWPNLIFWLIVSIVVLYLVLSRVALPRLSAVLSERHDAISNDIEMAALLRRRAEEAERTYDKALADARDEANRIADATRADMQSELKALMEQAGAEIAAKAAESEKRIAEVRAGAAESIEEVAREAGLAIVEVLMPQVADRDAVEAAVAARMEG